LSPTPKVSVVVPHYRDLTGLDICLSALGRQTWPTADFEIVVADNASPEGEAAVAKVIAGRARLVVVEAKGAAPARNGGVAAARGEILAFTDSDCQPAPEWLAEGLAALAKFDLVGGAMTVLVEDAAHLTPAEAFERVFAFDNAAYVRDKAFTVTANLFCPRVLFDRVGGFRTGVSEDLEWSLRARDAGYRIGYAPAAVVGHPARRTWAELTTKWRRVDKETFGLSAGRPGGRLKWLLRALALPASALVHTPKVLASRKLSTPGERLGAIAVLYRLRAWRAVDCLGLLFASRPA